MFAVLILQLTFWSDLNMPFWKHTNDIISNIRILDKDNHDVLMLISSYDKTLLLMNQRGEVLGKNYLDHAIEIDSLETYPISTRHFNELKFIFAGCSIRCNTVYIFDKNLQLVSKRMVGEVKGGINFIKGIKTSLNGSFLIIGRPHGVTLVINDEDFHFFDIKLNGTPVDTVLINDKTLAIANVASKEVCIYELDNLVSPSPSPLSRFILESNPSAINALKLKNETFLVISEVDGKISLRDINGDLLWVQRLEEPIMWRRILISDVDNDSANEIIVGCQSGIEDVSKRTFSSLFILDPYSAGTVKYKFRVRGWIKDFRILNFGNTTTVLIAAGKKLYHCAFSDSQVRDLSNYKFDKAVWTLDVYKMDDNYIFGIGFAEGEVGIGKILYDGQITM